MIGSRQGGIAHAIMQAVAASPEELRSLLLANIVLVGGNCKIPGFLERLFYIFRSVLTCSQREVRSMAPVNHVVHFAMPTECDPVQ